MSHPVSLRGQAHVCPACDPGPKPHVGGPITETQQSFVTVEGVPIATFGDSLLCTGVPTTSDKIISGSSVASIQGKKIARLGDACAHGGRLVEGVSWITFE